jgi:beta-glucanase (GH16 family)
MRIAWILGAALCSAVAAASILLAGEQPTVKPDSLRTPPVSGHLLGGRATIDAARQLTVSDGVHASILPGSGDIAVTIQPTPGAEATMAISPAAGRWDLRSGMEVRVKLQNTGIEPISPRCRLESDKGPTDTAAPAAPIAPGALGELIVHFAPAIPWRGLPNGGDRAYGPGQPGTGTTFTSDAASKVVLLFAPSAREQSVLIRSIVLDAPPARLPAWLGKRPPVAGEWKKTFDDEFNGSAIDASKWNVDGTNFYDHRARFAKENVLVGNGVVRLRYEKLSGSRANRADFLLIPYAMGYLDTFGKWTQRYGYFEARMKLPHSPGLWPAFWMMPDRGAGHADRSSTADGGMEFDIMEYLTHWGPYRYNIAMHWDGYAVAHKEAGCETVYVQPDRDGWITSGLLWTPGSAIFYCNGVEILRWEDPRISSVPSDIMLTMPANNGWENDPIDDAKLPDDFTIDYVRCWQRKDLEAR